MLGDEVALLVWGFPLGHCARKAGVCQERPHPRRGAAFHLFRCFACRADGRTQRRRQGRDRTTAVLRKYDPFIFLSAARTECAKWR